MSKVEELAVEIRNHSASTFSGEASQEDVIQSILRDELTRLEEAAERDKEVEAKHDDLREQLGLSGTVESEAAALEGGMSPEEKQAELRDSIR